MNSKVVILWGVIIVGLILSLFIIGSVNKESLMLSHKYDGIIKEAVNSYMESENASLPFETTSDVLVTKGYLEKMIEDKKDCSAKITVKKVLFFKSYKIHYSCMIIEPENN